jgi:hypothetical protein
MAMKIMKTVPMYVSIALICACVTSMAASASERGLNFRGAMVNGGCDGLSAAELDQVRLDGANTTKRVTVDADQFRTTCGAQNVPLEARYVDLSSALLKGHSGLITLTYR